MNRQNLSRLPLVLIASLLLAHCGQQASEQTASTRRGTAGGAVAPGASTDGNPSGTGGGGKGTGTTTSPTGQPTAAQLSKSQTYFLNNVLPLFQGAPCSDCHAAPRNLKDPNVDGGLRVQEHNPMFDLLKDGPGANDNKLIHKLLNVVSHRGGKQCADENTGPCGVVKKWYTEVFGQGTLMLGRIESINREGMIAGWAGSLDAPTTSLEVRLFLDGDKATGRALTPIMANLEASDNNIPGPHGFAVKIPADMIDGRPHKVWAYTTYNGKEVLLSGSPFDYTAYKPKGTAVATAFAQTNLQGCNGPCHTFSYDNRWGTLLGNGPDGTWTATSNAAYQKLSGALGHSAGAPALPGSVNLQAVSQWWTQEFATP
jgi:hypothetical protein